MPHADTETDLQRAWGQGESLLATSPAEGLAALDQITGELLRAHGYDIDAASGNEIDMNVIARVDDPEMLVGFIEAHAVTEMLASGRTTGPETLALAHEAYRGIYENLG